MVTGKSIIERRRSSLMESVVGGHRLNRSGVTWDDNNLTGGGRCVRIGQTAAARVEIRAE